MNEEIKTTFLDEDASVFIAIARKHPFIGLGMLKGFFGEKAKALAEKYWASVPGPRAVMEEVCQFNAEWEIFPRQEETQEEFRKDWEEQNAKDYS